MAAMTATSLKARLPPLPPLTARNFRMSMATEVLGQRSESQSPKTQRPSSFESRRHRPQTPRPETPQRPQTPRLSPQADSDTSPYSSNVSSLIENAHGAAGVAANLLAANDMRERCFAAHEGLVAKRAKRSKTKCFRTSSADGSPSNALSNGESLYKQAAA